MKKPAWEITRDMFLAEHEIDLLLHHVRDTEAGRSRRTLASARLDRLIVEVLLYSGLRTSEFCRLTLADTVMARDESVVVVAGPGAGARTVHVPQRVSELVVRFCRDTRPGFLPDGVRADDLDQPLVFNERGRPYERTGLYRRVKRVLTEAGLGSRASVQLLRHTYGYLAYKRTGGNLLFVQRQLGHAHPMVTSVYERLVDESYPEMADRIDLAGTGATLYGG